ncbi:hypothetical protein BSL78_09843 [Apostichopus japonicus]|uniref:NFX1-type zinc finger-containing protein 1-like n=1 Tax=Stichopus japonicus TaxID=307972 RepID=A0A2G8KZ40_STIJA|nr:hypothetical protein BSL78_09843 [Apostichopus japonicus]
MAESPSYFEAYRHILSCLQDINEDDFPFGTIYYYIKRRAKPDLPLYIKENPECKFDLSDLNNIALEDAEQMSCQVDVKKLKEVCVRDDENWPSHETLGFDVSQMRAYQAALREEVCLIQGPPGTGKTYVGLRIVKTILRNRARLGINKPLMVVCYTNHALDQFLEGITEFEPHGIVRIGGRSSSEKLRDFNLSKLRQSASTGKSAIWEYGQVRREMVSTAKKIENSENLVHVAKKGLLKYQILQQFMEFSHRKSLTCLPYLSSSSDPIAFWLGILDEVGECCVDPSNTYQNDVHFSAFKERTEPKRNLKAAINAETISEGEESDISEENKVDSFQTREEDNTATEAFIVLENEEFERRYIDDEDDISDDEFVNTFDCLAMKIPEETIVALPDANNEQLTDESEWVKVRRRNSQKTALFIRHRLAEGNVMNEKEIKRVRDVWHLHSHQRWSLYRHWVQRYNEQIQRKLRDLCDEYNRNATVLSEMRRDEDLQILREKSVIGLTTTGAARNNKLLRLVGPRIIVVEEAAEILEAHVITSLNSYTDHLILIGDHQQLRPNPTVYKLCKDYKLDVSLFERLINNGMPHYRLTLQHRMRPEISQILKLHKDFYPGLRDHESVMRYEDVHGITTNLYFVEHDFPETHVDDSKSRSNIHEAQFLLYLCKYLLKQGYTPNQITILTAYKGQVYSIRQIMEKSTFEGVRVCPVDNFQGEENDIILFSFVRSNLEGSIGFLKVSNRVCVALSRAKKGLYCIGNFSLMSQQSELWATIVTYLRSEGFIGPSLKLVCRNHPERCIEAKTFADFKEAPDGGCKEPCSARLDCGHTCQLKCHPVDREHRKILCQRPCEEKVCSLKHVCPKRCWEDCPKLCPTLIVKMLPCSHEQKVQCYQKPHNVVCRSPCERELACGHGCRELCGLKCTVSCPEVVEKVFTPCGHKAKDVTTILFGNEDDPKARFIQLEDCNHIVEVQGMDRYLKQYKDSHENMIKLPECPWCKTPIRNNQRYKNIIKAIRSDVEKVKIQIKGDTREIRNKLSDLIKRIDKARNVLVTTNRDRRLELTKSTKRKGLGQDTQWRVFFNNLKEKLDKSCFTISLEDLSGMNIILDMYDKLLKINDVKAKILKGIPTKTISDMKEFTQFQEYYGFLKEKIKCFQDTPSDQEIEDWQNEYQRCRHSLSLVRVLSAFKNSDIKRDELEMVNKMAHEVYGLLSDGFPFSKNKE